MDAGRRGARGNAGHGVHALLEDILGLSSGSVAVARVVDHVLLPNFFRFFNVRPFVRLVQRLPLGA